MPEKWDAYDRFRRKLGYEIVRGEPIPAEVRHLVVHMIYYNSNGEILLQRRSEEKDLAPGVWAFTGGSALAGEDSLAACVRETVEEMGFSPDMSTAELILSYVRKDSFTDVYLIKADISIDQLTLQPEEVAEAGWFSKRDFEALICDKDRFWQYSYLPVVSKYITEMGYLC